MYGTSDDPLLARAEAAAMYDMSKSSAAGTHHHLGFVKDSLYGHHSDHLSPLHHNNNRHPNIPIHGFPSPGESMLDQLSAVSSMPLSGYAPEHACVTSYPHSAQMYNVSSHSGHGSSHGGGGGGHGGGAGMQASLQQMYSPGSLSPHSAMSHPSHHDLECDPRELEAFAEHFKQRRIKLGVTQADVGSALGKLKIPGVGSLSQSTICRFESLTLSHNNMIALKPVLHTWLEEAETKARVTMEAEQALDNANKKKRTSITAAEKRSLEAYFAIQPRPSGEKISQIAEKLGLKKSVVRVWFCNQRQKQKRMKFSSVTMQGPRLVSWDDKCFLLVSV